jgi:hypothetical protein
VWSAALPAGRSKQVAIVMQLSMTHIDNSDNDYQLTPVPAVIQSDCMARHPSSNCQCCCISKAGCVAVACTPVLLFSLHCRPVTNLEASEC